MLTGYLRICTLKVYLPYTSVVFSMEVLDEFISKVFGSLLSVQAELIFLYSAAHPVESHVKGLGAFPAHVAGEDDVGGCAIGLDRVGWLRVAHLSESSADGAACWPLRKIATVSSSMAESMTVQMV